MSVPGGAGPLLVHGMGRDLVEPDWPPLTDDEVTAVLARFPGCDGGRATVTWRSPRPMSAAGLARCGAGPVFLKRHDTRVRTLGQLAAEHAFADHLRARGLPVPAVVAAADGASAIQIGRFVYEVHQAAAGVDAYRDAVSWSPFASLGHARAAGAALARLHAAAAGFRHPARPPGALISSCDIVVAADPLARARAIGGRRPRLASYLTGRPWQEDLASYLIPAVSRAAPLLAQLPRRWGHGDWHPSNLTWTSVAPDAEVAGVIDLGLCNLTFAVHDLAVALERATVSWLGLPDSGRARADLDAVDALLEGYESVRPLTAAEAVALPAVLRVVHLEYALSEVEYFADVVRSPGNADLAYDYLVGHVRWFDGPDGAALLDHLRRRASS